MNNCISRWTILIFHLALLAGCAQEQEPEWTMRQLTTDTRRNHDLDNNLNFSPDGTWLCYDTRDDQGGIGDTRSIEKVNVETGEIETIYEAPYFVKGQGPGVGAVSYFPDRDAVIFIHGPFTRTGLRYEKVRRVGAIVRADGSGIATWADSRDVIPPFTPGALRGGTHRHEPGGPSGNWIGFTYNDLVMKRYGESMGKDLDLRTIGVTRLGNPVRVELDPQSENRVGAGFSVLVVKVVPDPRPGTDEIRKADGDGWVGAEGYYTADGSPQLARAFIGELSGGHTEVFVVDIPESIMDPGPDGPLEGTETTFPMPPRGTVQRRLTHTESGCLGVVRSTPDGSRLAYRTHDPAGQWQIHLISPLGGEPDQVTFLPGGVTTEARWDPSGRFIVCASDQQIYLSHADEDDPDFGKSFAVTERLPHAPSNIVWSPNGQTIAFNIRIDDVMQIFVLETPARFWKDGGSSVAE